MRVRGFLAMALLLGGCRVSTVGLGTEEVPLDDAGNPIADGTTGADGDMPDVNMGESSMVFPTDDSGSIPECTGKANGTVCGAASPRNICVDGECIPSRCGDNITDKPVEDCDDGNIEDGDFCPGDCKAKCTTSAQCGDSNECSIDSCDTARHICNPPMPVGDRRACTLSGGGVGVCN